MKEYKKLSLLQQSNDAEIWISTDGKSRVIERIFFRKSSLIEIYGLLLNIHQENLPTIFDIWETDTGFVVIEEYIEGVPINELIAGGKTFTLKECRFYALQICSALKALHKKQIVHRDIKPANLMITEAGQLKLIDFDAARLSNVQSDKDTRLLGTEGYAAPEQYGFTQTDFRADIYALGVTLKEMLPATKNKWLHKIFAKCERIDPGKRYQTIEELEHALKHPFLKNMLLGIAAMILLGIAAMFLIFSYPGPVDIPVEIAVKAAADNEAEAQMMKQHYWAYPNEGPIYVYRVKESCYNDIYVVSSHGDIDDLYLLQSNKKVKNITFSGKDAAVFSYLKTREYKENGKWFTKIQFMKHLPSNEKAIYAADGLITFEGGEQLPFKCIVEIIEDFNPSFSVPYEFYEGKETEVTVYVADGNPDREYSFAWQITDGQENAGFAPVSGGPNDHLLNQKPKTGKTNTVTVYARKPGLFVLRCYVTGMVDGKPITWACEMDDAEVLPAESE